MSGQAPDTDPRSENDLPKQKSDAADTEEDDKATRSHRLEAALAEQRAAFEKEMKEQAAAREEAIKKELENKMKEQAAAYEKAMNEKAAAYEKAMNEKAAAYRQKEKEWRMRSADGQTNKTSQDYSNGSTDAPTATETKEIFRALQADWENPYYPDSFAALQDLIRQYENHNIIDYYAKTMVFVQSSGTGKSRLADTLGQSYPMVNFILREPAVSGFPPTDVEILSFLRGREQHHDKRTEVAWNHARATALLQASFEIFNTWTETKRLTTVTLETIALKRHDDMAPHRDKTQATKRNEFGQSVAEAASKIAKELMADRKWLEIFDNESASQVHHALDMEGSALSKLRHATQGLVDNLKKCRDVHDDDPLLVIVFDEASSLLRTEISGKLDSGLYVAFNRIIACLKRFKVWSFFLSTESLIRQLVPPNNDLPTSNYLMAATSSRQSLEGDKILKRFPPFVGLQLDVEDRRRMKNPKLRSEELLKPLTTFAKLSHMALFGRPLWHAYVEKETEMLKLAKLKIIGGVPQGNYAPANADNVFAALSFRLSLDVCLQNPCTIPLNRRAVNAFMRVVISIDQETGVMNTITPSEPVLAIAAMECLCAKRTNWAVSIETLSEQLLETGLVDKGHKGELYARLVLILAHDWIRFPKQDLGIRPTFTVLDLLSALYAQDHHQHIKKIDERILQARMNFTHFVPAYARLTSKVVPSLCRDLFRRSAAMQLCENQNTYDLLLPIYYGPETETFDESKCGVIVVQVKNRVAATTMRAVFGEHFDNISPWSPGASNTTKPGSKPPRKSSNFVFNKMANLVLCLLFDLGIEQGDNAKVAPFQVMRSKIKDPIVWGIHSRGHDEKIFGCLKNMGTAYQSKRFFTALSMGKTLAEKLSSRNRPFYRLGEKFRYGEYDQNGDTSTEESETGEEEETREGGSDAAGSGKGVLKRRTESTAESESKKHRIEYGKKRSPREEKTREGGSDTAGPGKGLLKRRTESTSESGSKRQRIEYGKRRSPRGG